ncbi:MAG TPA: orotidine-5'-phosphate decarboxylase [Terriglobales bacterium]|jgi:orotidine-5'-phosphate decarboxylase|nr:orotidine-5'-phosphate decarboxylase [Terriglobales bacterium]
MTDARERLIVALDVSSAAAAQKIVAAVGDSAFLYKVGKQLFTAEGPAIVRDLVASGRRVFLDLKFHDIPNTVAAAVAAAAKMNISMLTVHASGGSRMLKAATDAAAASSSKPMVLGVTVLTSFRDADVQEVGFSGRVLDNVLRLAALARSCGCGGIVTSAKEAAEVRRELGAGFAIVTPGVRPAGSKVDDQARVVTPAEAIANGASHIVVGRPITAAADPAAAAQAVVEEMAGVTAAA